MKKELINRGGIFSIGIKILALNTVFCSIFLAYEEKIYSKENFIAFIFIYGSSNIFLFYLSYRGDKKYEKELDKLKKMESKDSFIKKYLSSEEYKEFQETLNNISENEEDDFRDLIFSELLKKQAEKCIKGGNDN